jgi:putative zinc finger protein
MNCRECNELLPLFADHTLTQDEEKAVQEHLNQCSACSCECEKFANTLHLLSSLDSVDAPDDFHARCMERLDKEHNSSRRWKLWGTLSFGSVAAAAVVLLVVVVQNPLNPLNKNMASDTLEKEMPRESAQIIVKKSVPDTQAALSDSEGLQIKSVAKKSETLPPLPKARLEFDSVARKKQRRTISNALIKPVSLAPAAARSNRGGSGGENYTMASKPKLVRQTGEWSGDVCAILKAETLVAATPAELQALWQRAGIKSVPMPQVNWKQKQVGAIFLGNKQGHGYEIRLKESQKKLNQWVVKYAVIEPSPVVKGIPSQPFLIFLLPKSNYSVVFTQE